MTSPMLGVCYYPEHWPEDLWAEDARRMAEIGLRFVRVGEFAWGRIEPEPGRFAWDWLDRAITILGDAGLKVVLGTPTATPPKWLIDRHPDILAHDRHGRPRRFGSRRHCDFSSTVFRAETARIVTALAERYGRHPAVVGWQTDNEYGCHDTARSYSPAALVAFRAFLARRHGDVAALNDAWGNRFWSMEYDAFDAIDLPHLTVTEPNPAHVLDFFRFASSEVADYNRAQVEIIRERSPGRFVTHNFMGGFLDFDHFAVGRDLDLASWDSYPLGHTEALDLAYGDDADAVRRLYARTGHPDVTAFHHDLYRAVGRGRFWVMEQQPGPVNWAPWNPAPADGMVRLWTWEAIAHGAEVVSYFRWRQALFAQEQMHAGLNRPDRVLDTGGLEAARVARELAALDPPETAQASAALVFDYEAAWYLEVQPQGADFRYLPAVLAWYGALRRLGLDVDVLPPGASLAGYRLAVVPCLPRVSDAALDAFRAFDGPLLFGPRAGSKTESFQIPADLPPGPLAELLPLRVTRVESLRPGLESGVVLGNRRFAARSWAERVETRAEALARFEDGGPALIGAANRLYLACRPDRGLLDAVARLLVDRAGLAPTVLPEGLRLRRRGPWTFAFNRSAAAVDLPAPAGARFLLGGRSLEPHEVAVWTGG